MRYLAPDHKLSLHFQVWEFCQSETADAHGIEIRVVEDSPVHENLRALCHYTLEPIRDRAGVLHLSSGYRPDHVNELVGGSPTSQHPKGEAGDIYHDELRPIALAHLVLREKVPFDQMILEHDQGVVHISHVRTAPGDTDRNRREALTRYRADDGSLRYLSGIRTGP